MSFVTKAAAILFKEPFTQKIGKLEIDIVSSRTISEKTSLTNNPIEGGFNTDNVFDQPTEITINGIMSKFSLNNGAISRLTTLPSGDVPNRLKEAHDELYRIKDAKEPILLVMPLKSYSSMVMVSLNINSNPNDGDTFRFTVGFKEVRIVESQLISIDNSVIKTDTAKKKSSFGRQTGETKTFTPPQPKLTLSQFITSIF